MKTPGFPGKMITALEIEQVKIAIGPLQNCGKSTKNGGFHRS